MKQEQNNLKNQPIVGSLVESTCYRMDKQSIAILPVVIIIHAIVFTALVISSIWSVPYIMESIPIIIVSAPPQPPVGGPASRQDNTIKDVGPKPKEFMAPSTISDLKLDVEINKKGNGSSLSTDYIDGAIPWGDWTGNDEPGIPTDVSGLKVPKPPESEPRYITPATGIPPQVISRIQPDYPELAKKANVQGKVILEAVIDPHGTVKSLNVLRADNPLLEQAAINAAMQWAFSPGKINGYPVLAYYTITIIFELK